MKSWLLSTAGSALLVFGALSSPASAQEGYQLNLQLTTDNALHDPDGIWSDDDLRFSQSSMPTGFKTRIYKARVRTPAGEWLLTQTNGDCNMQSMCTTLLYLLQNGRPAKEMASAQVQQGGSATLSLNYRKIMTNEIDQNGKPFQGSYDVEPIH